MTMTEQENPIIEALAQKKEIEASKFKAIAQQE